MPQKRRSLLQHRNPGVPLFPLLLLCLCAGCGLDDSAVVECRCTPETNLTLFPACPRIVAVTEASGVEHWVTSLGDTLDPENDQVVAHGNAVRFEPSEGTNPLSTQIPACPVGPRLNLYQPTRPELVVFNIRTIFRAQPEARNLDQYMDQLSEDFTFVPDEQDIQLHPEIYDTSRDTLWNRDQERRFAQAILDPRSIGEIRVNRWYQSAADERIPSEDQLLETFIFPYDAEFTEILQDGETSVLAIKGWMEVDLVTPTLENPVWTIQQWRDLRDPATAKRSWGELRAEFAR